MSTFYGKECSKHPETLGRRYAGSTNCIKCHNERSRANHARRKLLLDELFAAAVAQPDKSERLQRALEAMGL